MTENDLQKFLRLLSGNETFYMNLLQGGSHCPISDNCVSAADVHPDDAARAVTRIMGRDLNKVMEWAGGPQ